MSAKKNKTRKKYSKEQKTEVVRYAIKGTEPLVSVAEKFGVPYHALMGWIKEWNDDPKEAFRGQGKMTAPHGEVARLKKELAQVTMERDFLKKVSAYFAGQPK
jgi:transposase